MKIQSQKVKNLSIRAIVCSDCNNRDEIHQLWSRDWKKLEIQHKSKLQRIHIFCSGNGKSKVLTGPI